MLILASSSNSFFAPSSRLYLHQKITHSGRKVRSDAHVIFLRKIRYYERQIIPSLEAGHFVVLNPAFIKRNTRSLQRIPGGFRRKALTVLLCNRKRDDRLLISQDQVNERAARKLAAMPDDYLIFAGRFLLDQIHQAREFRAHLLRHFFAGESAARKVVIDRAERVVVQTDRQEFRGLGGCRALMSRLRASRTCEAYNANRAGHQHTRRGCD